MKESRDNLMMQDQSEKIHYTFEEYPVYIRKDHLADYPGFSGASHWHKDLEFIYIVSGKMKYSINGRQVALNEGTGLMVNSHQFHFGYSEDRSDCEFICLIVSPLLFSINDYFEKKYVRPLIEDARFPFLLLSQDHDWQKEILACLKKIYNASQKGERFLEMQQLLYQIWYQLFENTVTDSFLVQKKNSDLCSVKAMVSYIHQNYTQKVTLEQIAGAGHVCKSKCSALFKSYLSRTPGEYLNEYRLRKSLDDLMYSDMTISELSGRVGINSASYYSELFRKYFFCSPKEYVKQHSAKMRE